ncbi:TPR-like protein [Choiromyces venosus 120613-1]|uniref:TPR-like protein n=1 Tax=Choiromyces venosus 120613-1 TaxID=1336337 RepID=A0A3N4KE04_9PEZI|nr:TPR-like protein [Choiromyces venosus 120613-1]
MVAFSRNDAFTGRRDIIARLKELLEDKNYNRIALYGLGGAGKTQIALEYVHQRKGSSHVFWVHGSSFLKFSEDYRRIFLTVGISHEGHELSENEQLSEVKQWFESPASGSWIMILDNADNEADFSGNKSPISRFIPQSSDGKIIITTRSRVVASRQGCSVVEVPKMSTEEAKKLFFQRFSSTTRLQDHDLEASDKRRKSLLSQQFCDIRREVDMTESILSTYFITFERIKEQNPKGADLLRLIAFVDRQKIPEELFVKSGLEGMDDSIEFRMAIGVLLSFSFVSKAEDTPVYELHRLVQQSIQVYLSQKEVCKWRRIGLEVILKLFPQYKHNTRDICAIYLPHALAIVENSEDSLAGPVHYRVSMYLRDIGHYSDAEVQIRRCIQLKGDTEENDLGSLARYGLLATVLQKRGRYEEAEEISRRVLQGREQLLGPDHPDTLTSVGNLALVLGQLGKHIEAEKLNRQNELGLEHPETLNGLSVLFWILDAQGKYDEAEEMTQRALDVRKRVLGLRHPDTLSSLHNHGVVLWRLGRYEEAETLFRQAHEGQAKVLGPEHPNTLSSVDCWAMVLVELGKYGEAEQLAHRALNGYQKLRGLNDPCTQAAMGNLGLVLARLGRYDEAEKMLRTTVERREKVQGPDSISTLKSVSQLALVLHLHGNYEESERLHRRVYEIRDKKLGPMHLGTLSSLNNLASVMRDQGKNGETEAMCLRAMRGYAQAYRTEHPDTLTCAENLALVLYYRQKYQDAEKMQRGVLEGREKIFGPNHPCTIMSADNLAAFLMDLGRYDEAEQMSRRAVEGSERALGLNHPQTLRSLKNLVSLLQRMGME